MILEKETFEKFGYRPDVLSPMSNKKVVIKCDYCNSIKDRRLADLNLTNKECNTTSCASKQCNILKRKEIAKIKHQKHHPKNGDKFGRWEIISEIQSNRQKPNRDRNGWYYFVTCKCKCGKIKDIQLNTLLAKSRPSKSCGCFKADSARERLTTHGQTHTKLYRVWLGMRDRCNNPKNKRGKYYFNKGIRVCQEWGNFIEFQKWAFSHGYKEGLFIERIDSNKNYCPENCEWITAKESGIRVGISVREKKKALSDENQMLKNRVNELELLMHKNLPIP